MSTGVQAWLIRLLVVILPLQGMMAVGLCLRGPAHVHIVAQAKSDDSKVTIILPRDFVVAREALTHAEVERHYHGGSDGDVIFVDDQAQQAAGEASLLLGGFANLFVALTPTLPVVAFISSWTRITDNSDDVFESHFSLPLERPPIPV